MSRQGSRLSHGSSYSRRAGWGAHLLGGRAAAERDKGGRVVRYEAQALGALQPYEGQEQADACMQGRTRLS